MKNSILKLIKNKLFVALTINAVIMIFCVFASSFAYDSKNDFYNSLFICKYHYPYNNDINFILASIFSNVQYILPNFNCFVLFQVLLSYLSFSSITYALTDKFGFNKGIIFSLLISILFALNHYADIASQKTAALLFAAGFLLVFNSIRRKRYRFMCLLGIVEILLGTFYCFEYFYIALAFAAAYLIADLISKKKYKIKFRKFMWYFRPFLIMYLLIAVLAFSAYSYSYSVNTSTQELKNNYEYFELTDKINNFPFPGYEKNAVAFNEIGIGENEYELLKDGYYDENTSLNLDALRLVSELQDKQTSSSIFMGFYDILTDTLTNIAIFNCDALLLIIVAIICVIYFIVHKKSHYLFPILLAAVAVVSSVCMRYYFNSDYYTLYGIWILLYATLLYSIDFDALKEPCQNLIIATRKGPSFVSWSFILILFLTYSLVFQSNLHNTYNLNEKPSALYTEVNRHPERYYILDTKTAEDFIKYTDNYQHPLWGFKSKFYENVDNFGYLHRSSQLKKHNTDNVYSAAVDGKKVYVIDNYITYKKEQYFTDYYSAGDGQRCTYNLINEINGYKIYTVQ